MARVFALPHLHTDAVTAESWNVELRGQRQPLPQLLKAWDYQTALRFDSIVRVDRSRILRDCGLGPDAAVSVVALWWASSTNRRELGVCVPVTDADTIPLEFEIAPGEAGGRLALARMLVLTDSGSSPQALAATAPGAVLWREDRNMQARVFLEGDAARFPTEVVDFASTRVADPDGVWWLDVDFSDLSATPLAALRLYLNGNHPEVKSLVANENGSAYLHQIIEWDVVRTMFHAALDSPAFHRQWGSFRPGSLGEAVELLARRLWPGEDARSLATFREYDRGLFEARLQGRLRLLGDQT